MALYSSLESCHQNFLAYQAEPNDSTFAKWNQSIDALMNTISSIEPVIKVFQSNLWTVLRLYCWGEFFISNSRDRSDIAYRNYILNEEFRSKLVVLDLLTAYDNGAQYDPTEPQRHIDDTLEESIQRLIEAYYQYLEEGNIDALGVIKKYQGPLVELDDYDFKLTINKLKHWLKSEFKPEELI